MLGGCLALQGRVMGSRQLKFFADFVQQLNSGMTKYEYCDFCEILQRKDRTKQSQIIAQDQQFFAFHDIDDGSAIAHILICTKKHIQSALHLQSPFQLSRMKRFTEHLMANLYQQRYGKPAKINSFRFGFHVPPLISVYHIHLHALILPFRDRFREYKYIFGPHFKSVQTIIAELSSPKL